MPAIGVNRRRRHARTANHGDQVETTMPHRYNRGMSATEKLAISLPKDLIEKLRRAKDEGRIDSVSGHIAELLRREDDWRGARATPDRLFERGPGPEGKHYARAPRALGVGNPAGRSAGRAPPPTPRARRAGAPPACRRGRSSRPRAR